MRHTEAQHDTPKCQRLLAAARRLFTTRGYLGVSVGDLVAAATVSRPVLSCHFGSKEGLYRAAVGETMAEFDAALTAAARRGGALADRVVRVCRAYAEALRDASATSGPRLPAPVDGLPDPGGGAWGARLRRTVVVLRELLAEGRDRGELPHGDPDGLAVALAGAASATALLAGGRAGGGRRDRLDEVIEAVLAGAIGSATTDA